MPRKLAGFVLLLCLILPGRLLGQGAAQAQLQGLMQLQIHETGGTLFENVAKVLAENYVDKDFRTKQLPALIEQYRSKAAAASSLRDQRQVVEEFLSHIPASHLGLLSVQAHRTMMADLVQVAYPSFGFQVVGTGSDAYAAMILEGGPAERAGLLAGDRLVTIDGTPVEESPRLDWRTDDAYIGDERDPSVRFVLASAGDRMALHVERRPGEFADVTITAEDYTAFDAAEASVRVFQSNGLSIGYLHFWFVHVSGVPELIKRAVAGRLKDVNGLVIDLRGRGGSALDQFGHAADVHEPEVQVADRQSV